MTGRMEELLERLVVAIERSVHLEEVRLQRELGKGTIAFRSKYGSDPGQPRPRLKVVK